MRILGLQRDVSHIHCALLSRTRQTWQIASLQTLAADSSSMCEALARLHPHRTVAGLASAELLLREVGGMVRGRYLAQSIAFQEKSLTILPEEESRAAHIWQKGSSLLAFFLTRRDCVQSTLAYWAECGVTLDRLSAHPLALWRYVSWRVPSFSEGWILDLGEREWSLLSVISGRLTKVSLLSWGNRDLLQWGSLRGGLDIERAWEELTRIAASLRGEATRRPWIWTGCWPPIPHVREWILEALHDHLDAEVVPSIPDQERLYAGAIGAALEEGLPKGYNLQFLQDEWVPEASLRRWGRRGAAAIAMALCLQGVLFGMGETWTRNRENSLREEIFQALALGAPGVGQSISLHSLSGVLQQWEEALVPQLEGRSLPLEECPNVSAILTELTLHSSWRSEPPCHLLAFRYQRELDSDRIQIDFEFQAPSLARAEAVCLALREEQHSFLIRDMLPYEVCVEGTHVSFSVR